MNIINIIEKVRDKKLLTKKELEFFSNGVANNTITDYHISAFTMAVYLNGMKKENIVQLTQSYVNSGDVIKWPAKEIKSIVDKHSTGGVGDKISLTLIPLLAALGLKSAKLSGKGLGQTGGTIDKLQSIPGFKTNVSETQFRNLVLKKGMAIIEANKKLAPADKRVYAIRDVTSTVGSIPLIAASIMSKKIAAGSKNILIDLKVGSGAFTKNIQEANELAKAMKLIASSLNKHFTAVLSSMEEPLGFAIGNANEVAEAYEVLQLRGPVDVTQLTVELAAEELLLAKKAKTIKEARDKVKEVFISKAPLNKFLELIKNQGGDIKIFDDLEKFTKAKHEVIIKVPKSSYVKDFDTNGLGLLAKDLGAGREKITDKLDYKAGIYSYLKVGDKVNKGDTIFVLQSTKPISPSIVKRAKTLCKFSNSKVQPNKLIKKIIR